MTRQNKAYEIIDAMLSISAIGSERMSIVDALCKALYASSRGTKHFYEALEFLSEVNFAYKEEFLELKTKCDADLYHS